MLFPTLLTKGGPSLLEPGGSAKLDLAAWRTGATVQQREFEMAAGLTKHYSEQEDGLPASLALAGRSREPLESLCESFAVRFPRLCRGHNDRLLVKGFQELEHRPILVVEKPWRDVHLVVR